MTKRTRLFWIEKLAYDAVQSAIRASQNSVPVAVPKQVREDRKLQQTGTATVGQGVINRTTKLANKSPGVVAPTPVGVGAITMQARFGSKANVPGVPTKERREQAKLASPRTPSAVAPTQPPVPTKEAREQAKLASVGHVASTPNSSGLDVRRRTVTTVTPPRPSNRPMVP